MVPLVWSWGWENEGCLGTEDPTKSDDSEHANPPQPVALENIAHIASGNSHVLALTNNGDIYSWGRTTSGRLGYVTGKEKQTTPLEVHSNHKFAQISCGNHHNLAITTQGQIASWGSGFSGQCGQNNKLDIEKPTIITTNSPVKFIKISAGYYHSMALDENKNIWVWGTGRDGQLGLGTNQISMLTPTPLKFGHALKFANIIATEFNSFAITQTGETYVWGGNRYGAIGDGKQGADCSAWTPRLLNYGVQFKTISMNAYFAVGISTLGKIYYWGRGMDYKVTLTPTLLQNPVIDALKFVQVNTKSLHILFLSDAGEVYVMGNGEYGQLGLDGVTSSPTVQKINTLSGATEIATGNFHSLALTLGPRCLEVNNIISRPLNRTLVFRSRSEEAKQFLASKKKSSSRSPNPREKDGDDTGNQDEQQ